MSTALIGRGLQPSPMSENKYYDQWLFMKYFFQFTSQLVSVKNPEAVPKESFKDKELAIEMG